MTIASALDHLTDVLANKDVAGYQTIEQSINSIADMITDGEITIGGTIEPATASTLGGVKIGEGISVTSDGTISAGASVLIVNDVSDTLDKTWQEIYDAVNGGSIILIKSDFGDNGYATMIATGADLNQGTYEVWTTSDNYTASSADGYPAISG